MNNFKGAATASTTIKAPPERVWQALTDPALVREYLYGAEIVSDWKKGSPITYKGVWKDKPYEDKGEILEITPGQRLMVTHYSPLSGQPDVPENYHTVTYAVTGVGDTSTLTITQVNNRDQNEVDESQKTWATILGNIKALLEK